MKKTKSLKHPKPGCFLLKDNKYVDISQEGREKGIVLNERYYLDLDSLSGGPVAFASAQAYGQALNQEFPTIESIQLVEENLELINLRLLSCGRGDRLVTGDLYRDYWLKGCEDDYRRRVLFVIPLDA